MKCYYCPTKITVKNRSEEHIIPNSLGGRISSYQLLWSGCNKKLGSTIDTELYNQVGFIADIIGVSRDRKKANRKVKIVDSEGKAIYVGKGLVPKPRLLIDRPNLEEPIVITAKDEIDLKKLANKKQKELQKKGEKGYFKEITEEPNKTKYHFVNNLSLKSGKIGFGGRDFFRAVGKIAINFLLYNNPKIIYSSQLINFIKGEQANNSVFFYYPSSYKPHQLGEKEISHIIYINGDAETNMIYAYIEIFNSENFIIIIDQNYHEKPFEYSYCLDLNSGKELKKEIRIRLTRQQLLDIKIISDSHRKNHRIAFNSLAKKLEDLQ